MNNQLTTIYIVRHGQTEWNVKGLLQGHADSPLTQEGENQAKQIAQELRDVHFDKVFSSDLLRAKRTAEIIVLEKKLAVKTTKALREMAFGKFEGKPYKDINDAFEKLFKQYEHLNQQEKYKLKLAPDIETSEEAVSRFITFLRELAVGLPEKIILIVTHGSVIRHFLIHIGLGTHETLANTAIAHTALIKIESDGVDFFIKETKGVTITTV